MDVWKGSESTARSIGMDFHRGHLADDLYGDGLDYSQTRSNAARLRRAWWLIHDFLSAQYLELYDTCIDFRYACDSEASFTKTETCVPEQQLGESSLDCGVPVLDSE